MTVLLLEKITQMDPRFMFCSVTGDDEVSTTEKLPVSENTAVEGNDADGDNNKETGQFKPEQETGEPRSVDISRPNFFSPQSSCHKKCVFHRALADLGGVPGARPPWVPILSFSHTCLVKSACIGGPRPP